MPDLRHSYESFINRLKAAGIRQPEEETNEIIRHVLKWGSGDILPFLNLPVTVEQIAKIEAAVSLREKRYPIVRIFGATPFCDLLLQVSPHVFRPYPESEDVIEHTLKLLTDKPGPLRILDLGTGSGCLLLALLKALPGASGVGIDIDPHALEAATENARLNQLSERALFQQGDWGQDLHEIFDLVISNPPRVASAELPWLSPEMREHDPLLSLDGGSDGIQYYKYLVRDFRQVVKPNGLGVFQIGPKYADLILAHFHSAGLKSTEFRPDYIGRPCALVVYNR